MRALLRRVRPSPNARAAGSARPHLSATWPIDFPRRPLERAGAASYTSPLTEWAAAARVRAHIARQTLTHGQLFHAVWGNTEGDAQQYLRVYVGHLRRKLETDPGARASSRRTPRVGYRFEPDGVLPT